LVFVIFLHPPLEGGSKNSKNFSGRGYVDAASRPEILFSLTLKDNFDPPSWATGFTDFSLG
jgi:hypothetical protein